MGLKRYDHRPLGSGSLRSGRRRRLLPFLLLVVPAVVGVIGFDIWRTNPPRLSLIPEIPALGPRTLLALKAEESTRGLHSLQVDLLYTTRDGGEGQQTLLQETFSTSRLLGFWGDPTSTFETSLEVGRETVPDLAGTEATIRVTARQPERFFFHRPAPGVKTLELPVRLTPPRSAVVSRGNAVTQAGSGVVVYRVATDPPLDQHPVEHGVQAGERWFPGYPLEGGAAGEYFALYAVPFNLGDESRIRLVARDAVGNEATAAFVDSFQSRPPRQEEIRLSDPFLERVVPLILEQTPSLTGSGDPLQNYLNINGDLRAENDRHLGSLAGETQAAFLWNRVFEQLPNSQVMSAFALTRTYIYEGRAVDQQTHLGYDLASTRRAPVPAANDGRVVLARYFGIYGNAVVLDHGFGLMSLYAHLSSLEVAEGESVRRRQVLGHTGATGLAGGDHLHFTMLLHGVAVDPREWWDRRWIRTRIAAPLGTAAFPYQD